MSEQGPDPASEREFMAIERETRKARPSTRTLREATAVFFRFPTPAIIGALLLVAAAARVVVGGLDWVDGVVAASVLIYWPFQEWFAHKYILHLEPFTLLGRRVDLVFARRHRAHHHNPSDFPLIFLPWPIPPAAFVIFFGLLWLVLPQLSHALTFMVTISAVALFYEWIHYLTHTDYKPKSGYVRRVWRNHRLHHYKNEHHWFSFTLPVLDEWMGTGGDHTRVEKSETVRTIISG